MKKNNKGFVVSAVLYPLLVLFLALIMGLISMSDTRKRILDKMKLEISDSIFDEATCSCDTILNKLNYLIKNGVSGGGGGGSYQQNVLGLSVNIYEDPSKLPNIGNGIGDIAVITDVEITSYYVSSLEPLSPKHGMVWIVQDKTSKYFITSDYSRIGVSYAMQYICNDAQTECKWEIKKAYVYDEGKWILLYYVPVKDGIIDLTSSDINAEIVKTFNYTGDSQLFTATFSGYYLVELWGAQGGTGGGYTGGNGAYTQGKIYLDAGESFYVYVGGTASGTTGGWNGGGNGLSKNGTGSGGGGATDIRLVNSTSQDLWSDFESLKSRIMVAAGGAGGSNHGSSWCHNGGAGGTFTGQVAPVCSSGAGYGTVVPTQSRGGVASNKNNPGSPGGFGYGGNSQTADWAGSGGGGGWYGGAGSTYAASYVSGGSSYISGHAGCSSIEEESTSLNIIHNGDAYHYSGKYFSETEMKAAQNTGNGRAQITLLSIEVIDDLETTSDMYNREYIYSGNYQVLNIEKSGTYKIELWGAKGGSYGYTGGNGSYTSGNIYLDSSKVKKLYLYVTMEPAGHLWRKRL